VRSDEEVAAAIVAAHAERRLLDAPLGGEPITGDRAYRIQDCVVGARLARGEQVAGWKLGYTSAVMRAQMGIDTPNYGPLTDAMLLRGPATVPATVSQPRVEPEVALVIDQDISGPLGIDEVADAVRSAHAALEVVDSVWTDYSFTWADNTADGSSAAYAVIGPALPTAGLRSRRVTLLVNGEAVAIGVAEAAMGDPLAALCWLSEQLGDHPRGLRAGDVIITGGLTAAMALNPGDTISADFEGVSVELIRGQ
jgi:2-keto-4-pentenoate hydratase